MIQTAAEITMDTAIINAVRRRDELSKQLSDIKGELSDIETFLTLYGRFGGHVEEVGGHGKSDEPQPDAKREDHQSREDKPKTATRAYGGRGTPPQQIAEKAMKILRDADSIIDRYELAQMIENSGMKIASQDKGAYLKIILDRNVKGQFEAHGRGLKAVQEMEDQQYGSGYLPTQPPPAISDESPA